MYPLDIEKAPKFLFGNLCYSSCPNTTIEDIDNNLCKCKFGWHQNNITKEITCYDNEDYCLSKEYYYHSDTKECVLGGCREGYYQLNFECFNNQCPNNTYSLSEEYFKCKSKYNYCHIDDNYKTHCNNKSFDEYKLNKLPFINRKVNV